MPGKTPSLDELLKKSSTKWVESVTTAKSSGEIVFNDGTYLLLEKEFSIQQAKSKDEQWGVLFQHEFLEGEYKDKIYFEWMNLMHYDQVEHEGEFNPFLVTRLSQLTGQEPDDLDITQLEVILEDAYKENQVWQAVLKSTTKDDASGTSRTYQRLRLKRKDDDYTLPKKGNKTTVVTTKTAAKKAPAKAEAPFAEEDTIKFSIKGKEYQGEITAIDDEDETFSVQVGKKEYTVSWADAEAVEPEHEFQVGQIVSWSETTGKGKAAKTEEFEGEITAIDEDNETLTVEVEITPASGKKKAVTEEYEVAFDDATLVEEDDATVVEEEEEESTPPFAEGDTVAWEETEGIGRKKTTVKKTGTIESLEQDENGEWIVTVDTGETEGVGRKKKAITNEVPASELTKVRVFEVEEEITFEIDGKEQSGKIVEIDEEGESLSVKVGRKTVEVPFDAVVEEVDEEDEDEEEDEEEDDEEEESEDEEDGQDEPQVGDTIDYIPVNSKDQKTVRGVVTKVDSTKETVDVKVGALTTKALPWDNITAIVVIKK